MRMTFSKMVGVGWVRCVLNCTRLFSTPWTLCNLPGSSVHGLSGKNSGVACHSLLQWIFPTQEMRNLCLLCLLHWQVDFLSLHHLGSVGSRESKHIAIV